MTAHLKARRYFQAQKDDLHIHGCSWYIRIGNGLPIGPFHGLDIVDSAVLAINAALLENSSSETPDSVGG